jgi:hypothetical protein
VSGLASAVLAAGLAAIAGSPAEAPALEPGARGHAVTALGGGGAREIPLTYLGTYRDFAGPGYDLHLVSLEGPEAERVGVAAGMSGSPVYVDGRLIGALAYRFGALPKEPVAGVTPIEHVLEAHGGPPLPARAAPSASRIATPLSIPGLEPSVRAWIEPQLDRMGFVLAGGGGSTDAAPAALAPGSPVGVQLVRGDMKIAATGTVTWVDGDTVYAFGHPLFGSGRAEIPMAAAEIVHTLPDLAGSVKMANIGPELGTIVEDRWSAIVGRTDRRARMIPLALEVDGGAYASRRYEFEVARSRELAPLLTAVVVANALATNIGYDSESTLLATGTLELEGLDDVPLDMAFAGSEAVDPALGLAVELFRVLGLLWSNPFGPVEVERLDLAVTARPDIVRYDIQDVQYPRGDLRPGDTLRLRCVLDAWRGEPVVHELDVRLPDRAPRSGSYVLAVGGAPAVDRAMGSPLERRVASAGDLPTLARALGDQASDRRLRAVVYEPGTGTVSDGVAWPAVPPTASRLLATRRGAAPGPTAGGSGAAALAAAEVVLDGPVRGLLQLRIELGPPPDAAGARAR